VPIADIVPTNANVGIRPGTHVRPILVYSGAHAMCRLAVSIVCIYGGGNCDVPLACIDVANISDTAIVAISFFI
jgi:hypothetical protein